MAGPGESGSSYAHLGTTGILIAVLVAVFGLRPNNSSEKPVVESKAGPRIVATEAMDTPDPTVSMILGALRPKPPEHSAVPASAKPATPGVPTKETYRKDDADRIDHVLIAAVPDPIQTQFGSWYDQLLEAYTGAICDCDYTPDRHWLPWDLAKPGTNKPPPDQPGVMVYRNTLRNTIAVLFVVGETPNLGVNASQLRYAIEQVVAIHKVGDREPVVKAVGPFFTGAQHSWLRTIRETLESTDGRVELVTGSANSLSDLRQDWSNGLLGVGLRSRVTQKSTILPNATLLQAVEEYLSQKYSSGISDRSRFAILKEADTGFGRSGDSGFGRSSDANEHLQIRYPMHISRLSVLAAEEQRRRDQKLGLASSGPQANEAGIVDRFTSFGGGATAAVADRIIGDAMAVVRRENIRYVGIQATDPRDAVYLTNRLRSECPYARVFLTDSDLVFTVPENKYLMRGAIVASTYPLYPPNQKWTANQNVDSRRNFFPSQVVQGSYNALASFIRSGNLREYRWPSFMPHADRSVSPPVWITTIGETGRFVMLDVREPVLRKHDVEMITVPHFKNETRNPPPPALLIPVRLAAVVACAILAFVLWGQIRVLAAYSNFRLLNWVPATAWGFYSAPHMNSTRPDRPAVYLHMTLMAAVTGTTPLMIVIHATLSLELEIRPRDWICLWTILILLGTGWVLCVFGQIAYTCSALWDVRNPRRRRCRPGLLVRIPSHLMMLFGTFVSIQLCDQIDSLDTLGRVLFLERAAGLLAGYSLVVPAAFLALAFLVYALHALRRDWLGTIYRLDPPFPNPDQDEVELARDPAVAQCFRGIHATASELINDLNDYYGFASRHWRMVAIFIVLMLLSSLPLASRLRSTGEGFWWDWLFVLGLFTLMGLVCFTVMRLLAGWSRLQLIMDRIVTLPIASSFERLPQSLVSVFHTSIFDLRERPFHLAIPLQLWQSVRTACGVPAADPKMNPSRGFSAVIASNLTIEAKNLVEQLRRVWETRSAGDAFGSDSTKALPKEDAIRAAETFVAVQAVLFLSILFKQLRTLAVTCVWTVLLLVLAATVYPFQPERLIMYVVAGLAIGSCVAIGFVLIQINRSELVSRISGSKPNSFTPDWAFLWNNVALLSPFIVVAAQASGRLRSVFEPILELIR